MKAAMVYPSQNSEKAISRYSIKLAENIKNNGVDIDQISYTAGSFFSFLKILPRLHRYDTVHIQHEYNLLGCYGLPFFAVFSFFGMFKKKNLVVTMHTVLSKKEELKGSFIKTWLRKHVLYFFQNKLIGLASNAIIVHANFFKDILIDEYGIDERKIHVIPQGVPEKIKREDKQKAKKELKLSGNVYLVIGSFVPDHGADIVIRQSSKIGKTVLITANPKAVNDRNEKRITNWININKKYVKENNLEEFVRFDIRELSYELWWKYFSAADIVLLPYQGGIGSGIFVDAIAAGKPIVASNIKFFREFSKQFGGIKIAKTEKDYPKIIKEAMKPKNLSQMEEESNRYFEKNKLSVTGGKYKKLYESLL